MTTSSVKKNKKSALKMVVLITLFVMLALLVIWHLLFPLLGISAVITTGILGMAMATILIICIATLLFFVFTGIGIFILGIGVFIWTALAILMFPLLFPIVIPVLLLMFVTGIIARRKQS